MKQGDAKVTKLSKMQLLRLFRKEYNLHRAFKDKPTHIFQKETSEKRTIRITFPTARTSGLP